MIPKNIWDKDVRVILRDGTELLADVFRPITSDVIRPTWLVG
jgi:predicted acyl esterase